MPSLLGVRVDAITNQEAIERCRAWLLANSAVIAAELPKVVFTPNPEILVYAAKHQSFRTALNQSNLSIPDGTGLVWLARPKLPERVTGTDLMLNLLGIMEQADQLVGFVLRRDGLSTSKQLAQALHLRWPKLRHQIIYADEVFTVTPSARAPVLICVALGCPDQETWCLTQRNQSATTTRLLLTVGGGVDFLTGTARRAPGFFRKLGLEWLWRVALQPKRIRRILTATIVFPWYVLTKPNKTS